MKVTVPGLTISTFTPEIVCPPTVTEPFTVAKAAPLTDQVAGSDADLPVLLTTSTLAGRPTIGVVAVGEPLVLYAAYTVFLSVSVAFLTVTLYVLVVTPSSAVTTNGTAVPTVKVT